jgi:hypothetical protein
VTRRADQITPLQASLGGVAMLLAAAIVAALGQLVAPDERLPDLGAPAQEDQADICPATRGPAADDPVVVVADELIECPAMFDGVTVSYRGEAVRAVLARGARSWVHLNDDPYALELGPLYDHRTAVGGNSGIPVSIPTTVADTIAYVGGPRHRGDILEVTGVFHRADPRDGGGPAIQADAATITQVGRPVRRSVDNARLLTAAVIAAIALGTALLAHVRSPERVRRL